MTTEQKKTLHAAVLAIMEATVNLLEMLEDPIEESLVEAGLESLEGSAQ